MQSFAGAFSPKFLPVAFAVFFRTQIHRLLAVSAWALTACQPSQPTSETRVSDSTGAQMEPPAAFADTTALDLLALKRASGFAQTESVTVPEDPVFHRKKRYEAVPLAGVLAKIRGYDRANPATTQVVFECADGYNPSMPLQKVLGSKAYLALRDTDAPAGQDWTTVVGKTGEVKTVAPFYVVYTDVPPTDETFKWPYNLVRIRLKPASDELTRLHPVGTPERGYALFRTHCLTCHALNGLGGLMGPELNVPKNITEYWRESDLRAFVRNPASYRHGSKMPGISEQQVSESDLGELLAYLRFMAGHKVKP